MKINAKLIILVHTILYTVSLEMILTFETQNANMFYFLYVG